MMQETLIKSNFQEYSQGLQEKPATALGQQTQPWRQTNVLSFPELQPELEEI